MAYVSLGHDLIDVRQTTINNGFVSDQVMIGYVIPESARDDVSNSEFIITLLDEVRLQPGLSKLFSNWMRNFCFRNHDGFFKKCKSVQVIPGLSGRVISPPPKKRAYLGGYVFLS